ncbi:MAG: ABC transporter permease, partial [Actinobacteria bacterium]|nr:ABC transporter permease [Actinomycetota bacterium]
MTILVFLLAHLAPGDPITVMAGPGATAELIAKIQAQYHLDQPWPTQYLLWMGNLLHGNLGRSIVTSQDVLTMIHDRLTLTLLLATSATLFSILLAVPLGVLSAVYKGKRLDAITLGFTSLAVSLPNFFSAIVLIVIFGVVLRWLPFAGFPNPLEDPGGAASRLIMPTIALGLIYVALLSRLIRSEMLDVLQADYVRTARGKGLSERRVLAVHALRNALLPAINLVTLNFAQLLGGTVIIEQVFSLPGMGQMMVQGVLQRDFPVIQGVTLVIGLV